MAHDPVASVVRYHAALNRVDLDLVAKMFADTAEYRSPSVGIIAGKAAILAAMRGYFAEYPDQVATDDSVQLDGPNSVRCEWHLRATSKSTGAPYVRQGAETITFDAEGLITRIDVADR